MIERVTDYKGYLVKLPANPASKDAVLFLHGFPGNPYVRNLDLALWQREKLRRDIFLLHYRGLGESPGEFLFTSSILEIEKLIDWLVQAKGYERVHIIGHSWGGCLAVNFAVTRPQKLGCIILLSPFCWTEKSNPLYDWFTDGVRVECPGIFGHFTQAEVRADFDIILKRHLPLDLAPKISSKLKMGVIQAKHDDITPTPFALEFISTLKSKPLYVELDQDHGFTQDRFALSEAIGNVFEALSQ